MSLPIKRDERKYTYGDYLTWNDGERWELIYGIPYDMTPAPSTAHQSILGELFRQFSNHLMGKTCKAFIAPFDVRIPEGEEDDKSIQTVVQPDLAIVCDRAGIDERGFKGAPDLIVEIISPSTAHKDMREKLRLYEKAGVREYWIVHPIDRTVMVFQSRENRQFGRPDIYAGEDEIKSGLFDDFVISLKLVFDA